MAIKGAWNINTILILLAFMKAQITFIYVIAPSVGSVDRRPVSVAANTVIGVTTGE